MPPGLCVVGEVPSLVPRSSRSETLHVGLGLWQEGPWSVHSVSFPSRGDSKCGKTTRDRSDRVTSTSFTGVTSTVSGSYRVSKSLKRAGRHQVLQGAQGRGSPES